MDAIFAFFESKTKVSNPHIFQLVAMSFSLFSLPSPKDNTSFFIAEKAKAMFVIRSARMDELEGKCRYMPVILYVAGLPEMQISRDFPIGFVSPKYFWAILSDIKISALSFSNNFALPASKGISRIEKSEESAVIQFSSFMSSPFFLIETFESP